MPDRPSTPWGRLKHAALVQAVRQSQRLVRRYPLPSRPDDLPAPVRRALALGSAPPPTRDAALDQALQQGVATAEFCDSRAIFTLDGALLPCWQEADLELADGWLLSPRYYPLYYALFQSLSAPERRLRMLEIGVRTGYIAVAFARAARGPAFYLGLDPNLYLADGLRRAHDSLAALRARGGPEFALVEGYSWDTATQHSLGYSGPFDLIHIDGDHTLPGKLVDLDLARGLLAPGGLVLVDDYDHHGIVSDAVRRALALGWFGKFAYLPTLRGLAVLQL
ncbi:MAG TPA: class I SAM-dependent methyltransferase [Roseiflexaceae bacterium]|nr:class I SAM-dependent methyltransferase [Roseiflexaceae bacterium]